MSELTMLQSISLVLILVGILLATLHFLLGKRRVVWLGKALGFGIGFAIAGAPGAFVGVLFGHLFDMLVKPRSSKSSATTQAAPSAFSPLQYNIYFDTLFNVLGHFAQARGEVGTVQLNALRSLMLQMELNEDRQRSAWELFKYGQHADFNLPQALFSFERYCRNVPQIGNQLLQTLVDMATAQLPINMEQYTILTTTAHYLALSTDKFAHLVPQARQGSGQQSGRKTNTSNSSTPLEEAYKLLGLAPSATVEEIKWAYRKLMGRYHPDRIISKDLPEDLIEFATARTQEIKAAYEKIAEERNIK